MPRLSSLLFVLLAGSTASLSSGQLLNWTNTSGGTASVSGNWSPAAVPGAANTLQFNLANTFGVTFNSSTSASLGHIYKRGTVTLSITSPHTAGTSGIIVGDTSGDTAITTLSSGSLASPATIAIADDAGSTGTLNVTGQAAALSTTGTGQLIVGRNGAGTINITNFASCNVASNLIVGDGSASVAAATISGASLAPPFPRSTLNVNGPTASRIGSGGDANLTITNGGRADFASDLIVANGSASTSSITVQTSNAFSSLLSVGAHLYLGRNLSAGTAAGNGTLTVNAGGTVDVGGTLFIAGDTLGGTGELNILASSASLTCRTLDIGSGGTIHHTSGTLRVDGGAFTHAPRANFDFSGGPDPSFPATTVLQNGATYASNGPTQLGTFGYATLRIESGSQWNHPTAVFAMGISAPSKGSTIVDGTGSVLSCIKALIGSGGDGSLQVSDGGRLTAEFVDIARLSGGTGTWTVDNGIATIQDTIAVGGEGAVPGGPGTLTLTNGAVVTANDLFNHAGAGSLSVTDSELSVTGTIHINNPATFTNATISAVDLQVHAPLSASGTINANIENGTAPINANGPLIINTPGVPRFYHTPLNAGIHTVEFIDVNPIYFGNTTINGGTLGVTPRAQLDTGFTLSGTGTIRGVLDVQGGTIHPTGPIGLVIDGPMTLSGGSVSGTRLEIGVNSSLNGTGSVDAAYNAQLGSRTNVYGTTSLGNNTVAGFTNAGELAISGNLTIVDSNGFNLGTLITLNGGTLHSTAPAILGVPNTACTLIGSGTINTSLENLGTISPGRATGLRIGIINISQLFQNRSVPNQVGRIVIQAQGTTTTQHDRIACSQSVTLEGEVVIEPIDGYVPANGDRISFITTPGSITGHFDTVAAPRGWHIEYSQNRTEAVFCAADFNSDGIIDFFDYLDFVAAFSNNDTDADFNFDGVIDFFDYLDFVAAFSSGC
ncbi:MAG: hypothetical protein KGS45_02175 [Planctomycetes bacterium]|nr:hypothetical protein [Planctomycetota bacterium]